MKQLFLVLLSTGMLLACRSANDSIEDAPADSATKVQESHAEHTEGLALNNGAQWQADSTTRVNVTLLQRTIADARTAKTTNYLQTAAALQEGLNKMVKECTMQGPDHDALHKWLEPLMEKVKTLKQADSAEKAAAILADIEKHLDLFTQYFK